MTNNSRDSKCGTKRKSLAEYSINDMSSKKESIRITKQKSFTEKSVIH